MTKKRKLWPNRAEKGDRENARLALLAQELGIAGMMVLVNDFGFSREQAAGWLTKMLEQAKTNRLMFSANTILAAYELHKEGKIK